MLTLEQGLTLLKSIIVTGKRHQDYSRVVTLATLYRQLITGAGAEELLQQFVQRETDAQFKQRVRLTQNITPAVCEKVIVPFQKIGRLDNIKKALNYSNANQVDARIKELTGLLENFYGADSLEEYLASKVLQLMFTDPNAFLLVDFKPFDANYEKAKPYPVEISSTEAVDFDYVNNVLSYLVSLKGVPAVTKDGKEVEAKQYTMYLADNIIQLTELPKDVAATPGAEVVDLGTKGIYQLAVFNPKAGKVQAIRVGYKPDLETDSRTFVNTFHAALPFFMKVIKSVSEFDLTTSLHAHPRLLMYAPICEGEAMNPCNNGQAMKGGVCKICNGTGKKISSSAQDAVILDLPDPNRQTNPLKLEDLVKYVAPPVELLEFQNKYIKELRSDVIDTVFSNDVLSQVQVTKTATEASSLKDEANNTLAPFAKQLASAYKYLASLVATFTDNGTGLEIVYEYPKDFKLKSVTELLADLKAAKDSGAPAYVIEAIQNDITDKLFIDDETARLRQKTKAKFMPFVGKSEATINFFLTSGYARVEDQILYTHSDTIFADLEQQQPDIYKMPYAKQWALIKAKVEEIKTQLPAAPGAIEFRADLGEGGEGAEPIDLELEAAAKLKGSVGGVQGILEVQTQVAAGVTQYDAGLAILKLIYKIPEAEAIELLGEKKALIAAQPAAPATV